MSRYLVAGIVQDIVVYKEMIKYPDLGFNNIKNALQQDLNLDYYHSSEDQDGYYWQIKPEYLNQDLAIFLKAQFAMYTSSLNHDMEMVIEKLQTMHDGEEILKLAASNNLVYFQFINNIIDYQRVFRDNGFDDSVEINYGMIAYFIEGKIIIETYKNIFRYFENNIRLQKKLYPIVDCVQVKITS